MNVWTRRPGHKKVAVVERWKLVVQCFLEAHHVTSHERIRFFITGESLFTIETLRSRFGDLTTNGRPRFAASGFTLAVCPYLGLKIRGLNSRLPCLFSFVRSLLFLVRNHLQTYVSIKNNSKVI